MDTIELNNGERIPVIGIGPGGVGYTPRAKTIPAGFAGYPIRAWNKFISRPIRNEKYIKSVANAFKVGFTLLDSSAAYNNWKQLAKAIKRSGIPRDDIFITTRVSNRAQEKGREAIEEEFFRTLDVLKTDRVDLLQFHWPVTDVYLDTWKVMENLYKKGYARSIGVANCNVHHLEDIEKSGTVTPAVNQFEIHPLFTQKELTAYCKSKGIVVEAYTPIARMDDRLVRLPLLKNIGDKHNKSIVQIVLRWHIQNGVIPIVRSLNKGRQLENISIFDFELTEAEMKAIDGININSRLRYDPDNCDFSIL